MARTEPADIEQLVIEGNGNLFKLTAAQRFEYYRLACNRIGLDWHLRPFDYFEDTIDRGEGSIHQRLTLYPNLQAAEQLACKHSISTTHVSRQFIDRIVYEVVCVATTADGSRSCEASGIVPIEDKQGNPYRGKALSSAMKQAESSAFRRAVLRLCGFSEWADENAIGKLFQAESYDPPEDALTLTP